MLLAESHARTRQNLHSGIRKKRRSLVVTRPSQAVLAQQCLMQVLGVHRCRAADFGQPGRRAAFLAARSPPSSPPSLSDLMPPKAHFDSPFIELMLTGSCSQLNTCVAFAMRARFGHL